MGTENGGGRLVFWCSGIISSHLKPSVRPNDRSLNQFGFHFQSFLHLLKHLKTKFFRLRKLFEHPGLVCLLGTIKTWKSLIYLKTLTPDYLILTCCLYEE